MQAKRYWPPTKHKLFYANIIVYGVTLVLLLAFSHELIWAKKALHGYLITDNVPPSKDRTLIWEANRALNRGEDFGTLQQILEQALQIEPYSEARLLLGICHLKQGDQDGMLAYYNEYRSINPSVVNLYTDASRVLIGKGEHKAAEQLVAEGITHFRRQVELYKPHHDPDVIKEFNLKASSIYNRSQKSLELLEKIQKQLKDSK